MKPRGFIEERREYVYPESDSYEAMIEFYSMMEGYRVKGLVTRIDWATGVEDESQTELYTNDKVRLTYFDKTLMIRDKDVEEGWIELSDAGSFIVTNEDGLMWELSNTLLGDDLFKLEIIGRRREKV